MEVEIDDEFQYESYLLYNPDLRHFDFDGALEHWKTHGKKENRIAKPISFDHQFYINLYPDLNKLSYQQAVNHFNNCGKAEGRLSVRQILNTTNNIVIVIHLFHIDLAKEMLTYVYDVKQVFSKVSVLISVNENISQEQFNLVSTLFQKAIIFKVPNKGTDNLPFLRAIQILRTNNIKSDYILKLHSKKSSNLTEGSINWRKDLILPITKYENLAIIQNYFKKCDNIGYVSAQKCVIPKLYDLDFPQNIRGVEQICGMFPHLEKEWTDFNAGNMFWISYKTLTQYLTDELIDYLLPRFGEGKPPCNLTDKGIYPEYICERLFTGVFCYDKMNLHVNEFTSTQRGIGATNGIVNHSYFYQPKVVSVSVPKNIIT